MAGPIWTKFSSCHITFTSKYSWLAPSYLRSNMLGVRENMIFVNKDNFNRREKIRSGATPQLLLRVSRFYLWCFCQKFQTRGRHAPRWGIERKKRLEIPSAGIQSIMNWFMYVRVWATEAHRRVFTTQFHVIWLLWPEAPSTFSKTSKCSDKSRSNTPNMAIRNSWPTCQLTGRQIFLNDHHRISSVRLPWIPNAIHITSGCIVKGGGHFVPTLNFMDKFYEGSCRIFNSPFWQVWPMFPTHWLHDGSHIRGQSFQAVAYSKTSPQFVWTRFWETTDDLQFLD